ncbi:hypothetical protein QNN95_07370 [Exiguobacterium acetylicum]|uniref:hypothetical protein n=1 Tax=Exiguobacterium acetylicum TaxID=41170 RepID=UPI0035A617B9
MKFKNWIRNHWFSIAVIFIAVGLSVLSVYYAWDLSKRTKDIGEKRAIYQLAITAIAASVGIGTIINSTRSASIAAESVRLTREKDLREQSSHLIVVSPIGGFPIDLPHYTSRLSHELDVKRNDIPNGLLYRKMDAVQKVRLHPYMSNVDFTLVNSGKGACLNLEYEFRITNVEKFYNYVFKFDDEDVLKDFVSYAFEIKEFNNSFFKVDIINGWMRKAIINLVENIEVAHEESKDSYNIKRSSINRYHEIVVSEEHLKLNIPTSFIILCRQYLLVNYLKSLIKEIYKNKNIPEDLKSVLNHEAIKPEAEIRLAYHDESDIRNGNYDFSKKTVELHSLRLVELNDYDVENEISYFLEISPLK